MYQRFKKPVEAMFGAEELTSDLKSHFIVLKILQSNGNIDEWNEQKLIENRLKTIIPDESRCAYHRYTLGVMWKPPKCCQHPQHPYEIGKKAVPTRPAPIHIVQAMISCLSEISPVGLALHKTLQKGNNERSCTNCACNRPG